VTVTNGETTEAVAPTQKQTAATSNPISPLALSSMDVHVPQRMSVRLTSTSRLALTDIGALFFTIFLSLAIGFGTTYFSHENPSAGLKAEFLAWVGLAALTLLIILIARWKMYREPTETVTYRLDTSPVQARSAGVQQQGGPQPTAEGTATDTSPPTGSGTER
jgi:hypothetical protein